MKDLLMTGPTREREVRYRNSGESRRHAALLAMANGNAAPAVMYQRQVESVALAAVKKAVKGENVNGDFETKILIYVENIAESLAQLAAASAPKEPNYQRPLGDYATFDWLSIGATIDAFDDYGVTMVSWRGHQWKRRSGDGKYGRAVWFSRPDGKDSEGENEYLRLITFKDQLPPEPLADGVKTAVRPGKPPAQQKPPAAPPKANGKQESPELFKYKYGDGIEATEQARPHFDAYRRDHNEQIPPSREALHAWCKTAGRI